MRFAVIVLAMLLAGCASTSLPGAIHSRSYYEQGVEARTRSKGIGPQLGLALAGGGIKAANFSVGVLQGLTEAGVMERVDAVSTVSGGGYAALWYFSRLLNPEGNLQDVGAPRTSRAVAGKFFRDCLPEGAPEIRTVW